MPSKYVLREYGEDNIYHVFNRGVEKRLIFLEKQDFVMFVYYIYIYTKPLEKVLIKYPNLPLRLFSKNLANEVQLLAFCLMDNHYHLLLKQTTKNGVSKLMKQIGNAYISYFNLKYKRVGPLMQGRFKAVRIETDEHLIHVSKYIHLNPVMAGLVEKPNQYIWSSFLEYCSDIDDPISNNNIILPFFPSRDGYREFVNDQIGYDKELDLVKHLLPD